MRRYHSPKLVLGLFAFILVFGLFFPIGARADSTTVPWLTGTFMSPVELFGVENTSGDYFWWLSFSPKLPDMSGTWYCPEFGGFCENSGSGLITGGTGHGEIWSSSKDVLLATFTGNVLSGRVIWDNVCSSYCPIPDWYYNVYSFRFSGEWSNGWLTAGSDFAEDVSGSSLATFDMTTTTPEPGTLTLIGMGLAGAYVRLRRR